VKSYVYTPHGFLSRYDSSHCENVCEDAGEHGDLSEIVVIVPHTFRFVCTDRSGRIQFQDDPDFTETKILVCADLSISSHTRWDLSAQISAQTNPSKKSEYVGYRMKLTQNHDHLRDLLLVALDPSGYTTRELVGPVRCFVTRWLCTWIAFCNKTHTQLLDTTLQNKPNSL
jgi:hypothetical protein